MPSAVNRASTARASASRARPGSALTASSAPSGRGGGGWRAVLPAARQTELRSRLGQKRRASLGDGRRRDHGAAYPRRQAANGNWQTRRRRESHAVQLDELALLLLALAAVLATVLAGERDRRLQAAAGTAFGAKNACSCRYLAGRELGTCEDDFVPGMAAVFLSEDDGEQRHRHRAADRQRPPFPRWFWLRAGPA